MPDVELDLRATIAEIADKAGFPEEFDAIIHALSLDHHGAWLAVGLVGHVAIVDVAARRVARTFRLDAPHWEDLAADRVTIRGDRVMIETLGRGLTNADDSVTELFTQTLASKRRVAELIVLDADDEVATRAFRDDGTALAVGSGDGVVAIHELSGRPIARRAVFDSAVSGIGWSASGDAIAAASWNGEVVVLALPDLREVSRAKGTPHAYGALAISRDGATVIRAIEPYADGQACAAVITTRGVAKTHALPARHRYTPAVLDADAGHVIWIRVLALGPIAEQRHGEVIVQDLKAGTTRALTTLARGAAPPGVVAVSGDGRTIAAAYRTKVRISAGITT